MSKPQYWMVKTEPEEFAYQDLEKQGWTHWDGVRNHQAKKNLASMQKGDVVLVYHSISDKAIVGIATVAKTAYPDPTDETGQWLAVRLEPVASFKTPVTLQTVKTTPAVADIPLVKQSRLSVMPLSEKDFQALLKLGETKAPISAR